MDLSCTTPLYDSLYSRWLSDPGGLLDLAEYDPSADRLLDLCGGTGAVSREALRRGGRCVTLLDLSPRCPDARVAQVSGRAEEASSLLSGAFDVVVCRQAVGYLDPAPAFAEAARVMRPGGRLAFNTFASPRWSARAYRHGGRLYFEASAWAGRRVLHLQASPGLGLDVTSFRWHRDAALLEGLLPWFDMTIRPSGRSTRWLCVRRSEAS